MAKSAKFGFKKTTKGWCINVPGKFTATGKRERRYFSSRAKAKEASNKLDERSKRLGAESSTISPLLAEQATAANDLLKPYGVTLLEVVRLYVEKQERDSASSLIEPALAEFQLRKEDRSEKQIQAYRHMAAHLLEDFEGRMLSGITGEEIEAHIHKRTGGPGSFNQRLRLLSAFWRWCGKKPRRWCDPDELEHIDRAETVSGHIGTLTAKQAKRLMRETEQHEPDCVLGVAIMLFTGMRREELTRLEPQDIREDGIEVPALSSKTKRRRFIHMPEPLAAWLKAYPVKSTVLPTNWRSRYRNLRRRAGFRVYSHLKELGAAPEELPEWPHNALRHTAATVALALGKPIETLVFEHGHTGGLTTLRNHYIGQISRAEAEAIWAIRPNPSGKK